MSAIQQAIAKLNTAIDNLDGSVASVEANMTGQQRDMFGAPIKPAKPVANANAVAQKLDRIIEQAETVLKEGQA